MWSLVCVIRIITQLYIKVLLFLMKSFLRLCPLWIHYVGYKYYYSVCQFGVLVREKNYIIIICIIFLKIINRCDFVNVSKLLNNVILYIVCLPLCMCYFVLFFTSHIFSNSCIFSTAILSKLMLSNRKVLHV